MNKHKKFKLISLSFALAIACSAKADPIFFDDFNDGFSGWTTSGNVAIGSNRALVPNSVRLRRGGVLSRSFSTVGWQDVEIGFFVGARSLESTDRCIVEISSDSGTIWTEAKSLSDGEDGAQMHWSLLRSPAYDNNPDLRIRYRTSVNSFSNDECYAEDVSLSGFQLDSQSCQVTPPANDLFSEYVTNFDPIIGNGETNRSVLTASTLNNGSTPSSPVITGNGFAIPLNAAAPLHEFEGRLELFNESTDGSFFEREDDYGYTDSSDDSRKHLPEFEFEFVQSGTHLIPVQRGIIVTDHPNWEFIIEPGRVWSEVSDMGKTRAAIPFSLQQRNANCMHNGLMTFLFDDNSASKVFYQITSETCAYFQFDMWGLLEADYTAQPIMDALPIASTHQQHVAGRMPQKSITALAIDYLGVNPNEFANASEVSPLDLSIYGVIVDGTHYVGGCETRYGTHPYCDALRVPSYSTSKTALASVGAMRLEKLHGDFFSQIIADWVPEATTNQQSNLSDVTVNNALDMATGNYSSSGYFDDEVDVDVNDFFLPETHAEKIHFSTNQYPRQSSPGTRMIYHTSDTFLVMAAQQSYHRNKVGFCGDVFDDIVVDDIWRPLGLDAGSLTTRRTYDPVQQPVGGLGASFVRDDVAKIGKFLGVDHGRINNTQVLEPEQLAASKFATGADPGLAWISTGRYNNAFWGLNKGSTAGCSGLFVPFMSGFGGITIAMAPSGVVYYYFSDGYGFTWDRAFSEAEDIRSSCISGRPQSPTNLIIAEETPEALTLKWTPDSAAINVIRFRVYRNDQLIAVTSGNEWTDREVDLGESHDYFVEAIDVIDLTSATGVTLSYQPATESVTVPALPIAGVIFTGIALSIIALRRRG
ncbi:MAG: hypothetical protein QMC22_00610 [Pseudomonadales bacterium]